MDVSSLSANNNISNLASLQNVAQQGNFKGHKVSVSQNSVIESFVITNLINFPNKTLAQRSVTVKHP